MNYGDDLPCALVVARQAEIQRNQNVLYNLVKPTQDNPKLVESNLKLANVLPKNRIYRMESIEELELFRSELLQRPLILQCTLDGGPGMACLRLFPNLDCRVVRFSENYIVLLNQNHPKILARLQMGLEVAQRAMQRSQPFILTFSFNDVIERLYGAILREFSETLGPQDIVNCHDGEIIIRYSPENRSTNLKDFITNKDMRFAFEDIDSLDLKVDSLKCAQARQRRSLPLDQGELISILKGWKFGDLDTTKDLLNAYAEISDGPTPQSAHAATNDVPHQRARNTSWQTHQPPSYESAVLHPVGARFQSRPQQYGYSHNSHSSTSATSHRLDRDLTDSPNTSKKVIRPPENFETDGYPPGVNTEYVNVGFYDDVDSREQKHRYAAQTLRSDYSNSNNMNTDHRAPFRSAQGKSTQHQPYQISTIGQVHMETEEEYQNGAESFI